MNKTITQLEIEADRASAKYIAVLRNDESTDKQLQKAKEARAKTRAALKAAMRAN